MKRLILAVVISFSLLFAPSAAAFNPLGNACKTPSTNGKATACSAGTTDPITGQNGVLAKVTRLIALVAGMVAVIMIIVSAIQFISAQGDAKGVADARRTLIGAVVGLVIVATAQGILTFVISKV